MTCEKCHVGYLLGHPEELLGSQGWVKCTTCGFCKKEEREEANPPS
jgi:hypothetical protein